MSGTSTEQLSASLPAVGAAAPVLLLSTSLPWDVLCCMQAQTQSPLPPPCVLLWGRGLLWNSELLCFISLRENILHFFAKSLCWCILLLLRVSSGYCSRAAVQSQDKAHVKPRTPPHALWCYILGLNLPFDSKLVRNTSSHALYRKFHLKMGEKQS